MQIQTSCIFIKYNLRDHRVTFLFENFLFLRYFLFQICFFIKTLYERKHFEIFHKIKYDFKGYGRSQKGLLCIKTTSLWYLFCLNSGIIKSWVIFFLLDFLLYFLIDTFVLVFKVLWWEPCVSILEFSFFELMKINSRFNPETKVLRNINLMG